MERDHFSTNLEMEKKINPFLRLNQPEILEGLKKSIETEEEIFVLLRELRDRW